MRGGRHLSRLPRGSWSATGWNVIHLFQVDHSGEGVELLEHVVRATILDQLRDRPVRICRVAEHDGPRRTGRGASGREFIGLELAMLERSNVLRLTDALHAERALLHDALAANRHVRVELPVQRLRERVLLAIRLAVTEPVEVANLVRTIVRAVTRADATVVDLDVESVRRVVRRVHRTDRFAG